MNDVGLPVAVLIQQNWTRVKMNLSDKLQFSEFPSLKSVLTKRFDGSTPRVYFKGMPLDI
ncbi:hypothetical protein T03_15024 [Trichinella britovi]|uniref:Uncharacterized protein n=1 Tax=Trichinella britovi TaxID=45882 RepID=A0A0V1C6J0_TRIBR|nr:hypothetical protein T03_15472 [Trichinella britovi]KRY44602.1 hypothetical protein T03_15193 [Trichinella britovi]KRY44761.1 hypothetical protein T03_15024 [Trichinella britovi]